MKPNRWSSVNATGLRRSAAACVAVLVGGCTTVGPNHEVPSPATVGVSAAWANPAPVMAQQAELTRWWTQFDDALLSELIDAARASSPSLTQAVARIRQARAALGSSQAATVPGVNGTTTATRSNATGSAASVLSSGLDASWEVDLFGGVRRNLEGAQARVDARVADWHGAQVSLAAEVASAYSQRRQCEAVVAWNQQDLASREATRKLTALKLEAGFLAPADLQRAEASVAEASNTLQTQLGSCAQVLNQLVALTGVPHATLQQRLNPHSAHVPRAPVLAVESIPARAVLQRPDVASAERSLAAASAAIGVAQANRLPQLSLFGSISTKHTQAGVGNASTTGWSFGPSLSLPLFDGGRGAAAEESARGSYDESFGAWQSSVRAAVQEVENALTRVDAIARREGAAVAARDRYRSYFQATETQYRLGAASLLQLEDARRLVVTSEQALVAAQLEQVQAWIALFKAVGGGWSDTEPNPTPARSALNTTAHRMTP